MQLRPLTLFFALAIGQLPAAAEVIISEDFETGTLGQSQTGSFSWGRSVRISVVNGGGEVTWAGNDEKKGPYPEKQFEGYESEYALRFFYPAETSWSEQRFDFGAAHPEVWIRFQTRVPINFKHRNNEQGGINKFFALWMGKYLSGEGPTVVWSFWPFPEDDGSSSLQVTYKKTGGAGTRYTQGFEFIRYPDDQGQWMEIVLHVKAATSDQLDDGVIELYRRWAGQKKFVQYHAIYDAPISAAPGEPQGWSAGYLMGWSNPQYSEDTDWLLDNFTVSTTSLLGEVGNPPSSPRIRAIELLK